MQVSYLLKGGSIREQRTHPTGNPVDEAYFYLVQKFCEENGVEKHIRCRCEGPSSFYVAVMSKLVQISLEDSGATPSKMRPDDMCRSNGTLCIGQSISDSFILL